MDPVSSKTNISKRSSSIISKDSIQRLLRDVKHILQHPLTDNGIYYKHDEEDMLKGYAMIVGPSGTPYFGGYYFFQLKYPTDYPYSPPKVTFCTNGEDVRFNPNLYKCGKVCVSILNTWTGDQWTSTQTISSVLLTLCSLFCENPLYNEPCVNNTHPDLKYYNTMIEYANIKIAVCGVVSLLYKKTFSSYNFTFHSFFPYFESDVLEHFKKNKAFFQEFAHKKKQEIQRPFLLTTSVLYSMKVYLDYSLILLQLEQLDIEGTQPILPSTSLVNSSENGKKEEKNESK